MRKPLIGVTAGHIVNHAYPWEPITYGQRHTYIDAVVRAGGIPVTIPLTTDSEVIKQLISRLDGVLLSGGNDVNPGLYGEKQHDTKWPVYKDRDDTDKLVLDAALEQKLPILGICRGMQFINVYYGGTLYQDLGTQLPNGLDHVASVKTQNFEEDAHKIEIDEDSKLYEIMQQKIIGVNSLHRQAIKKLGKGLRVTALSKDGVIEGVETDDERWIVCVQAHPESLFRAVPEWNKLLEAFVEKSAETSLVTEV